MLYTALAFSALASARALENGLGRTPPMGWNSWNKFGCNVSEKLIRETVDTMISSGMRDAGYVYVNVDDCWQARTRDERGDIRPDPELFPSGLKALGDYIHSHGMKFGIYSSAGHRTCEGLPASMGHEDADARKYAEWGVDFLKYDNCYNGGVPTKVRYNRMRDALLKVERPIFYSICEWGNDHPWDWAQGSGNAWRTTQDIKPDWEWLQTILEFNEPLFDRAGPGGWNDPDMLEVGIGLPGELGGGAGDRGLTLDEQEAHFALWALMKAPLLAGNDITTMSEDTRRILLNKEIIAVNQDPLGRQGHRVNITYTIETGASEVWAGPLANGDIAVVLFNKDWSDEAKPKTLEAMWNDLGLDPWARAHVRDLSEGKDLGVFKGSFQAPVNPHGAKMFRVTPIEGASLPLKHFNVKSVWS
jgi:alpha-galactosidase